MPAAIMLGRGGTSLMPRFCCLASYSAVRRPNREACIAAAKRVLLRLSVPANETPEFSENLCCTCRPFQFSGTHGPQRLSSCLLHGFDHAGGSFKDIKVVLACVRRCRWHQRCQVHLTAAAEWVRTHADCAAQVTSTQLRVRVLTPCCSSCSCARPVRGRCWQPDICDAAAWQRVSAAHM